MQDFLDYITTKWNVDLIIVLIVLLSGFFQGYFLNAFTWNKIAKTDTAYKVLAVSFIISIIWIWLSNRGHKDPLPLAKYFFSYFLATSLYELLINPFRNWFTTKFNFGGSAGTPGIQKSEDKIV